MPGAEWRIWFGHLPWEKNRVGRHYLKVYPHEFVKSRSIYPRLPIDEEMAVQFVNNLIGDTRQFSGSFMEFLFKGTRGFVAELTLALIALSFLYAHGGNFIQKAMKLGGFLAEELVHGFNYI